MQGQVIRDRAAESTRRSQPEVIAKFDALFAVEREINTLSAHQRRALRNKRSCSLIEKLKAFLRERRAKTFGKSETAKAIDYSLKRCEVSHASPMTLGGA